MPTNLPRHFPPTLLVTLALGLPATLTAQSPCYDFAAVDQIFSDMVAGGAPAGAVGWLERGRVEIYREAFGGYTPAEVVPIASATKWLTAACIMTLVDDGLVDLDLPASTWLPQFTGDHGRMTLRQMLSHTSGLPTTAAVLGAQSLTLQQAVAWIASMPMAAPPGTQFEYGGVSMQVAGRIAEIVTGQDWATLFAARIAQPLQMTGTDYAGLGATLNPRLAGGARSSIEDYGRFVRMLHRGGVHVDAGTATRVLSAQAVAEILRDQTGGVPIVTTPAPDLRRYGLGCWLDRLDGQGEPVVFSSPGAFGFTPWIDREHDLLGIVLVDSLRRAVEPDIQRLFDWLHAEMHFAGLRCYGAASPARCAPGPRIDGNRPVVAGDPQFALEVTGAPPLTLGALLVTAAPALPPLTVLGIDVHVDLFGAPPGSVPIQSASDGSATLPASLANVQPGSPPAFVQTLWARGCGPGTVWTAGQGVALRF